VGNYLPYEFVADDITKGWMEDFPASVSLEASSTFSRKKILIIVFVINEFSEYCNRHFH